MKKKLQDVVQSLLVTLLILILLEIVSTAFLPAIGLSNYRLPFNILIVLFLGFKIETPFLAILIFIIQYVHSFFSTEGWALGTVSGVIICMLITYLRELLHLSSTVITIVIIEIFQFIWFSIVAMLMYIRTDSWSFVVAKLWRFFPESLTISIIAPFAFIVLDRIWRIRAEGLLGDDS